MSEPFCFFMPMKLHFFLETKIKLFHKYSQNGLKLFQHFNMDKSYNWLEHKINETLKKHINILILKM